VKNKIQRILVNTVGINNVDHVGAASLLTSAGHAHLPFFTAIRVFITRLRMLHWTSNLTMYLSAVFWNYSYTVSTTLKTNCLEADNFGCR